MAEAAFDTRHDPAGRRIKILLTISDLRGGGAEREFSVLVKHLSRERFDPHLCFWRDVYAYDHPPDIPVHKVEKTRAWHLPKTVLQLRRLIDELRPDVVFSQLHYVNMVTGTALALSRHHPRWVCRQVNDPRREMIGVFAIWARRALRRADRAVGCCEGVSNAMIEYLRLEPARVATLRNVVDLEFIGRASRDRLPIERQIGRFIVVHAGRFHAQKNQAMLLEAFSRLRGRNAELWMLGEGPDENALRERAAALGLGEQVRWLGFQDNPYPFFRAADCFALTSNHEGLPNAIIEAMACGTPAVSTRCKFGPEELIEDGVSGRLTPVGNAEVFGRVLHRLCGAPDEASRLGAAARSRTLVDFDTQDVCRTYEDLFEAVL
ncbi:MAG: glycosyltransferase [Myxococcales bacterium]|nr:glycosyltransferase [Myxococcales bacterium]